MSTAIDELTALKIRAGKKQGDARITIIDHTEKKTITCTVLEGVAVLAHLVGLSKGHHSIHIVDAAEERKRKLTNPNRSTRRVFNCRTPEQWKELNKVLEVFYDLAGDPHVAVDLIIRALKIPPRTIEAWLHEGAQEPEWLK